VFFKELFGYLSKMFSDDFDAKVEGLTEEQKALAHYQAERVASQIEWSWAGGPHNKPYTDFTSDGQIEVGTKVVFVPGIGYPLIKIYPYKVRAAMAGEDDMLLEKQD